MRASLANRDRLCAVQASANDDPRTFFDHRWDREEPRRRPRSRYLESSRGIPPTTVAAVLRTQDTVDDEIVQPTAEVLDLPQEILCHTDKELSKIVALAVNRSGACAVSGRG